MDPDSSPNSLYLLALLLVASLMYLFASVVEVAIGTLSRARIQRLAETNPSVGRQIEDFAARQSIYLTVASITKIGALAAAAVAGIQALAGSRPSVTTLIAWACLVVGAVVLGWIIPRAAAAGSPEAVVHAFAVPIQVLTWILGPLATLVSRATVSASRRVGATGYPDSQVVTSDELKVMVAASEEEGLIEQRERTMIDNILELEEISVREVMVPRPDIVAVATTTTVRDAVDTFIVEGYSRLPVYRETIDDVVGILYGKDLFPLVVEGRLNEPVGSFARPAYFVPESKKSDVLLRELQLKRVQIAIVVDEYGGTAGLVTIEDLLEEIVGEIQDEFDTEEQKIVVTGEDEALIDGSVSIDDANDALSLNLNADEVDTIGGLVYEKLGRVPVVGDQLQVDHALLTVVAAHGRRVTRVRVKRVPSESANGSASWQEPTHSG